MPNQTILPEDLSGQIVGAIETLTGGPVFPAWYLNRPREPQPIDLAARIQGLATIWAEARTCFVYWAEQPDLDWDAAFRTYLPQVMAAESPAAYYDVLHRFIALLGEGHTYVLRPLWLNDRVRPPVTIAAVAGQPVVTDGDSLPKGSVITHTDGRPVADVLAGRLPLTPGGSPPLATRLYHGWHACPLL